MQKILVSILTLIFYSSIASADSIKIGKHDFGFVCTPYGMIANEQKINLPNDKYPSFSKNLDIHFDIFNSANQKMILAKGTDMKLKKKIPVSVAGSMTGDKMGSPEVKIKYMWYHKYHIRLQTNQPRPSLIVFQNQNFLLLLLHNQHHP